MDQSELFFHTGNANYFLGRKNLISLNMTEDEYHDAVRNGYYGGMTREGRIIIHEYAHWVQSVGTPYGFYLELMSYYENELLRQLEELIASRLYQGNQIKVSPPLKKYIEDKLFYNIQDEKLWELFGQWLDLYFLSLVTNERRDVYYSAVRKHSGFLSAYPKCGHTRDIENYFFLPHLFHRADNLLDRRLSEFIGREVPPKNIRREELYSKKNMKAAMASGLNGMSLQITHHSLWESYATAVEYADTPEEFVFPSQFESNGRQKPWNEYYDPLRYLEIYLPSANENKFLFLKSCIHLFDIVFSPPILPQCERMREDKISMFDFDIVTRFYAVVEAARYVGPLSSFQSAGEYVDAVCRALHWRTPDEVFLQLRRCWDSLEVIPAGKTFQHFIVMRMSGEYLPLNRIRFLYEIGAEHVKPCFLKLKDKIITNTKLSYGLLMETQMELMMMSAALRMEPLLPEPLEYDYEYYQHQLLRELVEKLWERNDRIITLTVPEACDCSEKIKSYLQSWLDEHFIDVQLNLEYGFDVGQNESSL